MENDYYVYVYIRPDINQYFYVGYGTGSRRFNKAKRSKNFIEIVNILKEKGLKPSNHIIANNLSKNEAKIVEHYIILKLLNEGYMLVNKYTNFSARWLKARKGI